MATGNAPVRRLSRKLSSIVSNHDWSFGTKTIGFFGGFCLILNNAIGAGVAAVPLIFVRGGPVVPIFVMVVIGSLSAVSAAMICEAMRHVPGNENFRDRVEYAQCVKYFMGKTWYRITVSYLVLALMIMNIAAIIISAQGVDQALIMVRGHTCGFELSTTSIICSSHAGVNSPFTTVTISEGYAFCLALAIPLGILNLDDNIIVQVISFYLCMFCIALWIWKLLPDAEGHDIDAYYTHDLLGYDYKPILGSVMSNFAFVITVPSWCNEKKPGVSVNLTIWLSILVCIVVYGTLGFLAASVFGENITASTNFLALMGTHHAGPLTAITCQFFPLLTALTGVPVCSIICRYNLLQSRIASNTWTANLVAVALPWAISVPLQTLGNGASLQGLLDWGSLLCSSICNLVIPFVLYIYYKRHVVVDVDNSLFVSLVGGSSEVMTAQHWALPGKQLSWVKTTFAMISATVMLILIAITVFLL